MKRTKNLHTQDTTSQLVKSVESVLSARRRCSVKLQEEAVIPQEYI